jgi:hypothetical protein
MAKAASGSHDVVRRVVDRQKCPGNEDKATRQTNGMPPSDCCQPQSTTRIVATFKSQPVVADRQRTFSAPTSAHTEVPKGLNNLPVEAIVDPAFHQAQRLHNAVANPDDPVRPQVMSQKGVVRDPMLSVARRVPLPGTEHDRPRQLSRPNSRSDNQLAACRPNAASKSVPVVTAPKTAKPVAKLTRKPSAPAIPSSSVAVLPTLPTSKSASSVAISSRDRGKVDRPTLSQMVHAKAAMDRKAIRTRVPSSKPIWGGAPQRKAVLSTKPLVVHAKSQLSRKVAKNPLAIGKNDDAQEAPSHKVTPAQIPLPPSPLRESVEKETAESDERTRSEMLDYLSPRKGDSDVELDQVEAGGMEMTAGPGSTPDTRRSASPCRTPITSLLTSIQQGFLFTPSSPLSPPQSYLPLAANSTEQFPFQKLRLPHSQPSYEAFPKTLTGFGTGVGEDVKRNVLGDVEVN